MMSLKLSKNSSPKRILVISQTNIGDVVLTCPVIDILCRDYPKARMDVVIGPKAASLFEGNPHFGVKVYNKHAGLAGQITWFQELQRNHYDCVVDLRRTALGFFLMPRYAAPVFFQSHQALAGHKKQMHLDRLRQVHAFDGPAAQKSAVVTTRDDEIFFEGAVAPALAGRSFVVMAPGAASSEKRWHGQGFAAVADRVSGAHKIVFVGDTQDAPIVEEIQSQMKSSSLSLAGKINLRQLAYVLKQCAWALTHDSGVMHLACYLDTPVICLWGPTNMERYAPWSAQSVVVRRNADCPRCQAPQAKAAHNCMSLIEVEDVMKAIRSLNGGGAVL